MGNAMEKPFRRQKIQKGYLKEVAWAQGVTGMLRSGLQSGRRR